MCSVRKSTVGSNCWVWTTRFRMQNDVNFSNSRSRPSASRAQWQRLPALQFDQEHRVRRLEPLQTCNTLATRGRSDPILVKPSSHICMFLFGSRRNCALGQSPPLRSLDEGCTCFPHALSGYARVSSSRNAHLGIEDRIPLLISRSMNARIQRKCLALSHVSSVVL